MRLVTIDINHSEQRVDNYLIRHFRTLPKSRIYRAIRQGEVRVNKRRVKAHYRLQIGDELRIPPLSVAPTQVLAKPSASLVAFLAQRILYEDQALLIMNKPAGLPVHGGSGVRSGLIEALRSMRNECKFLELVHRLDRDTSGCLLIAKRRSMLVELHHLLTQRQIKKQYLALVKGHWQDGVCRVNYPLRKNHLQSGERRVLVDRVNGKPSLTKFKPLVWFDDATLIEALPMTGRTHQIRVHAAAMGHPLAGDEKYGDDRFNRAIRRLGVKRLFLHAASLSFRLNDGQRINLGAPLDPDCVACLKAKRGI